MALIDRTQVAEPVLPKETVPVASLGGDVIVRGLLLSEQLALAFAVHQASTSAAGEDAQKAGRIARSKRITEVLALAVVLADDKPMWTPGQWDNFGAQHPADVLALYRVAERLNGEDAEEAVKN